MIYARALLRLGNCEAACETLDAMRRQYRQENGSPSPELEGCRRQVQEVSVARSLEFVRTEMPKARTPLEQAMVLARAALGNSAMEKLRQCPAQPAAHLLEGDLLVRMGELDKAREVYASLTPTWEVEMRLALCDWGCERLFEARDALADLYTRTHQPTVARCLTDICRQIGDYRTIEKIHAAADAGAKPIKSN